MDVSNPAPALLGLVGFGEAGQAFADGWRQDLPGLAIRAYDIKTGSTDNSVAAGKWEDYRAHGVTGADTIGAALAQAPAVFSLVTADKAHAAARAAAQAMPKGAFFFDGNSCAPDTKRASAEVLEAAGLRYVDTAIMAPVHPKLHRVPILVSGPHAEDAKALLDALSMTAKIVPGAVGRASSIKMMRSVMIKGLEALTLECLLSARKAGVDAEVIASLDASMPGWDWSARAAYNFERTTTHGVRRAAEMREVAKTVADLGLPNRMSAAIAEWQQDMGDLGLDSGPDDHAARADAILAALNKDANRRNP